MRRLIKRESKFSLFLFIGSIFIILGGVIVTITDSPRHFYIVLLGFGSLLLTLSSSEVEKNRYELLSFGFGVFVSAAFFWTSYFNFYIVGKIITAELFALLGIFILVLTFYIFFKQRRASN